MNVGSRFPLATCAPSLQRMAAECLSQILFFDCREVQSQRIVVLVESIQMIRLCCVACNVALLSSSAWGIEY